MTDDPLDASSTYPAGFDPAQLARAMLDANPATVPEPDPAAQPQPPEPDPATVPEPAAQPQPPEPAAQPDPAAQPQPPEPASGRAGWSDAQRALAGLALVAMIAVLIGFAATSRDCGEPPPFYCEDQPGLFDD